MNQPSFLAGKAVQKLLRHNPSLYRLNPIKGGIRKSIIEAEIILSVAGKRLIQRQVGIGSDMLLVFQQELSLNLRLQVCL